MEGGGKNLRIFPYKTVGIIKWTHFNKSSSKLQCAREYSSKSDSLGTNKLKDNKG